MKQNERSGDGDAEWLEVPSASPRRHVTVAADHASTTESSTQFEETTDLLILIPVFNDWVVLEKLLHGLDHALLDERLYASVLVVDDGSTESVTNDITAGVFSAIRRVDVLHLRRNLGHQRAIAIGLSYVNDRVPCNAIVVMDGDGEDDPLDVPRLYRRYHELAGKRIVFAERTIRSEKYLFRVFYKLYRVLHLLLTRRRVRVGNFSIVPAARLSSLVSVSELWSHYAAAVYKSRQPVDVIPTRRGKRLHGQTGMQFTDLVTHGLSAMAVYSEIIGVRLLAVSSALILLAAFGIACILAIRLTTELAIPGWATYTGGFFLLLLLQAIMFSVVFSFIVINGRDRMTFLPVRDYGYFVREISRINLRVCHPVSSVVS